MCASQRHTMAVHSSLFLSNARIARQATSAKQPRPGLFKKKQVDLRQSKKVHYIDSSPEKSHTGNGEESTQFLCRHALSPPFFLLSPLFSLLPPSLSSLLLSSSFTSIQRPLLGLLGPHPFLSTLLLSSPCLKSRVFYGCECEFEC